MGTFAKALNPSIELLAAFLRLNIPVAVGIGEQGESVAATPASQSQTGLFAATQLQKVATFTTQRQHAAARIQPELGVRVSVMSRLLDQLRCVDQVRLGKKMGKIDEEVWHAVLLELPG